MSVECSECERDLRDGHDEDCSRHHSKVTAGLEADLAAYKDQLAATNRVLEGVSARYDAVDLERIQLRGKCALLQQQVEAERAKVAIAAKRISRAVRMINPAEYQGTISVLNDALAALQSPEVKL